MIIDLHCDTASRLYDRGGTFADNRGLAVDISRMRTAEYDTQCFALFASDAFDGGTGYDAATGSGALWARLQAQAENFQAQINGSGIAQARSYADILANRARGQMSAVLTIEDAAALERCGAGEARALGIRMITLVWNYPNFVGNPHTVPGGGLTERGIELVRDCEESGIIIDAAHMNEAGFWDVSRRARRPFVVSHTCARAVCEHTRNLHDEQLRAVAESGGVAGLCYYPVFAGGGTRSLCDAVAIHAAHIIRVAGEDAPALGSDFDGFDATANDLATAGAVPSLAAALLRRGLTERQADKVMFGNADRLLRDCL